jgi:hypothetical protein
MSLEDGPHWTAWEMGIPVDLTIPAHIFEMAMECPVELQNFAHPAIEGCTSAFLAARACGIQTAN